MKSPIKKKSPCFIIFLGTNVNVPKSKTKQRRGLAPFFFNAKRKKKVCFDVHMMHRKGAFSATKFSNKQENLKIFRDELISNCKEEKKLPCLCDVLGLQFSINLQAKVVHVDWIDASNRLCKNGARVGAWLGYYLQVAMTKKTAQRWHRNDRTREYQPHQAKRLAVSSPAFVKSKRPP